MAALQHAAFTIRSRSPPVPQISAKLHSQKPVRISFSGSFPALKVPHVTLKLAGKRRSRGGGGGGFQMAASAAPSYASALADVAISNGTLETTSEDMEKIEKVFSEPGVAQFFTDPTVAMEKKREVVDEIVSLSKLQPHTANFLNILVDMKRTDLIEEIVKEFELAYNRFTDTEMAVVTSVVKLESQHLAQIAKGVQRLTGAKNVRIKTVIDPSLVAGFTVRYGGSKLIDMSVKKQLNDIASQLDLGDIKLAAAS